MRERQELSSIYFASHVWMIYILLCVIVTYVSKENLLQDGFGQIKKEIVKRLPVTFDPESMGLSGVTSVRGQGRLRS